MWKLVSKIEILFLSMRDICLMDSKIKWFELCEEEDFASRKRQAINFDFFSVFFNAKTKT